MGSFGLSIIIRSRSSSNKNFHITNNNNYYYYYQPKVVQLKSSGSNFVKAKSDKKGSFGIKIRASASEGTSINMSNTVFEKLGVKIERNPPESRLSELGVRQWPKWGCPPCKFPWKYDAKETCYLLQGKVKVHPEGSNDAVEFGAGDLVVFPKGMACIWDVSETVDKHYNFE